jgi:hypothetical protein
LAVCTGQEFMDHPMRLYFAIKPQLAAAQLKKVI